MLHKDFEGHGSGRPAGEAILIVGLVALLAGCDSGAQTFPQTSGSGAAPTAAPRSEPTTGTIAGTVQYPAGGVPPMTIEALAWSDACGCPDAVIGTARSTPQGSYQIGGLAPGTYYVAGMLDAPIQQPGGADLRMGGHAAGSTSGLLVCPDSCSLPEPFKELRAVTVFAGHTTTVDIDTWWIVATSLAQRVALGCSVGPASRDHNVRLIFIGPLQGTECETAVTLGWAYAAPVSGANVVCDLPSWPPYGVVPTIEVVVEDTGGQSYGHLACQKLQNGPLPNWADLQG